MRKLDVAMVWVYEDVHIDVYVNVNSEIILFHLCVLAFVYTVHMCHMLWKHPLHVGLYTYMRRRQNML